MCQRLNYNLILIKCLKYTLIFSTGIILTSCMGGEYSEKDITSLTRSIQGKSPWVIHKLFILKFGWPDRTIGSGLKIDQWDIAGGVLTYHPFRGPVFSKNGADTRLVQTNNFVENCIFGSCELTTPPDPANNGTRYWLGNVFISPDGNFHFEDSKQNLTIRSEQTNIFFRSNPDGIVSVKYAIGISKQTRLESLEEGTHVASVLFSSLDGIITQSYDVISHRGLMKLEILSGESMPFQLFKSWINFWD